MGSKMKHLLSHIGERETGVRIERERKDGFTKASLVSPLILKLVDIPEEEQVRDEGRRERSVSLHWFPIKIL